jgi:hypothetical protein
MDRVFRIVAPILIVGFILYYVAHKSKGNLATPHLGSSGSSLLSSNDKAMADKLEPFIDCINTADSKLAAATRTYRTMVVALKTDAHRNEYPSTSDFAMAGRFSQFEHENGDGLRCASGLEKASAMPKVADLDTIGADYAATLRKLAPLTSQADLYYEQRDFLDDHMARGTTLDSQLAPLLDHLGQLSYGMRAGVERENRILKQNELDAIEAREGKDLRWHALNFMIQSRATNEKMEELANSGKLDAASMEEAIQPTQTAFDNATSYAAAHPREASERGPTWSGIDNSASIYLTSLKELRRELQGKLSAHWINSQIDRVERDFNSMIDSYNRRVQFQ